MNMGPLRILILKLLLCLLHSACFWRRHPYLKCLRENLRRRCCSCQKISCWSLDCWRYRFVQCLFVYYLWTPQYINSNSISPGFILTELTKKSLSSNQLKSLKKKVPLQRFGSPKEIAEIALFLCSEKNYINGSNIVADGGFLSGYEI